MLDDIGVAFLERIFFDKNNDTLAAIVTVDGAWLDTVKRKLATPSESFKNAFAQMPKAENYNQ